MTTKQASNKTYQVRLTVKVKQKMKGNLLTPVAKTSPSRSKAKAVTRSVWGLKACFKRISASAIFFRPEKSWSPFGSQSSRIRTTPSSNPAIICDPDKLTLDKN